MFLQEISLIILQSLFIYSFFKYPIFNEKIENIIIKKNYITKLDLFVLNIIIFLNILIFFSIFITNIALLFYTYVLIILFMVANNFNQKKISIGYKDLIIL